MVEGNILIRLQQTHVMQQNYHFSLFELNQLPPWEYHVRMDLILHDQQDEKDRAAQKGAR